ncbi:crossover junction endodeoxyribonuclease RuvC [bacterium]|nr:crossover junction endodeoxyribonuclease RuvC [bacterium]
MRIIGIDPGTAIVGYGIIDFLNGECILVASGSVQTNKNLADSARLLEIQNDFDIILNKYKPDIASVEKLFFCKNQKTVISVAQGRGVILAALAKFGLKIFEYTPMQIKLAITGYGKATKNDVAEMVKKQIKYKSFPKLDDTADAIAMAVCYIKTNEV